MLWNILKRDFIQCTMHMFRVIYVFLNRFPYSKFCMKLKYFWHVNIIYIKQVIVVIIFLLPPFIFIYVFYYRNEPSDCNSITYWNLKVYTIPEGTCPDWHNCVQQ